LHRELDRTALLSRFWLVVRVRPKVDKGLQHLRNRLSVAAEMKHRRRTGLRSRQDVQQVTGPRNWRARRIGRKFPASTSEHGTPRVVASRDEFDASRPRQEGVGGIGHEHWPLGQWPRPDSGRVDELPGRGGVGDYGVLARV